MLRRATISLASLLITAGVAQADPIEGNWKTPEGATAVVAACGSAFCITLKDGNYAGRQIGRLKPSGKGYSGTVTDPADNASYAGTASVSGSSLELSGCAMKIFCKTRVWHRR
jgi:uncharacterized protein (DUF2147 family)